MVFLNQFHWDKNRDEYVATMKQLHNILNRAAAISHGCDYTTTITKTFAHLMALEIPTRFRTSKPTKEQQDQAKFFVTLHQLCVEADCRNIIKPTQDLTCEEVLNTKHYDETKQQYVTIQQMRGEMLTKNPIIPKDVHGLFDYHNTYYKGVAEANLMFLKTQTKKTIKDICGADAIECLTPLAQAMLKIRQESDMYNEPTQRGPQIIQVGEDDLTFAYNLSITAASTNEPLPRSITQSVKKEPYELTLQEKKEIKLGPCKHMPYENAYLGNVDENFIKNQNKDFQHLPKICPASNDEKKTCLASLTIDYKASENGLRQTYVLDDTRDDIRNIGDKIGHNGFGEFERIKYKENLVILADRKKKLENNVCVANEPELEYDQVFSDFKDDVLAHKIVVITIQPGCTSSTQTMQDTIEENANNSKTESSVAVITFTSYKQITVMVQLNYSCKSLKRDLCTNLKRLINNPEIMIVSSINQEAEVVQTVLQQLQLQPGYVFSGKVLFAYLAPEFVQYGNLTYRNLHVNTVMAYFKNFLWHYDSQTEKNEDWISWMRNHPEPNPEWPGFINFEKFEPYVEYMEKVKFHPQNYGFDGIPTNKEMEDLFRKEFALDTSQTDLTLPFDYWNYKDIHHLMVMDAQTWKILYSLAELLDKQDPAMTLLPTPFKMHWTMGTIHKTDQEFIQNKNDRFENLPLERLPTPEGGYTFAHPPLTGTTKINSVNQICNHLRQIGIKPIMEQQHVQDVLGLDTQELWDSACNMYPILKIQNPTCEDIITEIHRRLVKMFEQQEGTGTLLICNCCGLFTKGICKTKVMDRHFCINLGCIERRSINHSSTTCPLMNEKCTDCTEKAHKSDMCRNYPAPLRYAIDSIVRNVHYARRMESHYEIRGIITLPQENDHGNGPTIEIDNFLSEDILNRQRVRNWKNLAEERATNQPTETYQVLLKKYKDTLSTLNKVQQNQVGADDTSQQTRKESKKSTDEPTETYQALLKKYKDTQSTLDKVQRNLVEADDTTQQAREESKKSKDEATRLRKQLQDIKAEESKNYQVLQGKYKNSLSILNKVQRDLVDANDSAQRARNESKQRTEEATKLQKQLQEIKAEKDELSQDNQGLQIELKAYRTLRDTQKQKIDDLEKDLANERKKSQDLETRIQNSEKEKRLQTHQEEDTGVPPILDENDILINDILNDYNSNNTMIDIEQELTQLHGSPDKQPGQESHQKEGNTITKKPAGKDTVSEPPDPTTPKCVKKKIKKQSLF